MGLSRPGRAPVLPAIPRVSAPGRRSGCAESAHTRRAGRGADTCGSALATAIGGADMGTSDCAGDSLVSVGLAAS